MGLRIIISSAVELAEKEIVKDKLKELEDMHLLKTEEVYDCKDHATLWGIESKQEAINRKILSADWFICLIPEQTVGKATWGELELVLKAHRSGAQIAISVFHPKEFIETKILAEQALSDSIETDNKERVGFNYIREEAERILGNDEEQYWVSYDNTDDTNLAKQLHLEFKRLYYVDKVFRTQHLNGLSKFGREIQAQDIYFDKERANANNGFFENKYFPRKSVDGKLQEALLDKRKFIILLGAPGSGKTRSIYQLMVNPQKLTLGHNEQYSLGILANQRIVIVNQDNIRQVYDFLENEKDYISMKETLNEYYLICDQIKDVFGMLNNEELFRFFDMVVQYRHVHMIATSIPSAFRNFNERWKNYGRKPMEDDQLTKTINIPAISSDDEESSIRNWMLNELQGYSEAETIGDYIPKLNRYKQGIVERLYKKAHEYPCLSEFLSALQVTETFRHDTALFLAVLITRKNLYPREEPISWKEFNRELKETINFLIANNIIWIRKIPSANGKESEIIKELQDKDFSLEYDMDDEEEFVFDSEEFPETPISTSYTYGINEIVWDELEQEDSVRLLKGQGTLLKDFQNVKDVVKSAKEFYRAFPYVKSLRRILPRIPHTDCYDVAAEKLWQYVYEECAGSVPQAGDSEELLITIGMLIGRSKDIEHLKQAIAIIQNKGLLPDYNIIGELYSAGLRLGDASKMEVGSYVSEIRKRYHLYDNSFFSLAREMSFLEMPFDKAMKEIILSRYQIHKKSGNVLLSLEDTIDAIEEKVELASLEKLFVTLATKAQTTEQWMEMFNLHKRNHIKLRRTAIRQYFAVVANESIRLRHEGTVEDYDFMKKHLQVLLEKFDDIIADEDKISGYYYAIEASWNFRQSSRIYELYFETFRQDNSRLISMLLRTARNHEFQMVLNFLRGIDMRLKEDGFELNTIIFNNLIKSAPNMGEAMAVVPYITHFQDHTLANILVILKNKRKIKNNVSKAGRSEDGKLFYYAYSVAMRQIFFEQRKSPYVIGVMYNLATTAKHERFIRDTFLYHLSEEEKRKLIDYSSVIAAIRMKKNYRTLDEVWNIFNICRNHLNEEKMYIDSGLYTNLMRKVKYLCNDNELMTQREKIRAIIKADNNHIIRDEYFMLAQYRFFPDKEILDNNKISERFIKDMEQSKVLQVKLLNTIMAFIKPHGFDAVWQFYEFIVNYYQQHGKRRTLRPDFRTATYLMEAVTNREQFDKAEAASWLWCVEEVLRNNKMFWECYEAKRREFGLDSTKDTEEKTSEQKSNKSDTPKHTISKSDYKQRTDEIINLAVKDIYLFGSLTPTTLNRYLKDICDIVDDIRKDQRFTSEMAYNRKVATYRNVSCNLVNKYQDSLTFDALSYVYLIKLAPGEWDVKRWINELRKKEDVYKYDMVVCGTISTNSDVCRADIDIALDYFEFWEDIVHDIGYDPSDQTSVSETTEITKYDNVDDYDGYWLTRSTHCIREMAHFWHCLNQQNGFVDKTALHFIKRQMELFEQYGIPFPKLIIKGRVIDLKRELDAIEMTPPS